MKTIILCGGKGTRLQEKTEYKPKPMVEIGGRPILWHIMKIYAYYGFNEFILALGYKGDVIKDYFLHEQTFLNDFTLTTKDGNVEFHNNKVDDFKIIFAETGLNTKTGGRILKCQKYIDEEQFMVTYGDGISDINIKDLVSFHDKQGTISTITGVHPHSKYGLFKRADKEKTALATDFRQKPALSDYVNGGFMVFKKEVLDYLRNNSLEEAFPELINRRELSIYHHDEFWQAVDTYKDLELVEEIWQNEKPWAVWKK